MDKYSNSVGGFVNSSGTGPQCEPATRQLEIHSALSDQNWKLERAEAALGSLLSRIEPIFNNGGESKGAPPPA